MKDFNLKPVVAAAMLAGSLYAVTVRAGGLDVGGNLAAQTNESNPAGATVIASNDPGASGPSAGRLEAPPTIPLAAGVTTPDAGGQAQQTLDEGGANIAADGPVAAEGQWTSLPPFALPRVDVDVSGADANANASLPRMAVGPQYSVGSNATLGGSWERHDAVALDAHADHDPYTFGIRIAF